MYFGYERTATGKWAPVLWHTAAKPSSKKADGRRVKMTIICEVVGDDMRLSLSELAAKYPREATAEQAKAS